LFLAPEARIDHGKNAQQLAVSGLGKHIFLDFNARGRKGCCC
jgi:hypothetical protein